MDPASSRLYPDLEDMETEEGDPLGALEPQKKKKGPPRPPPPYSVFDPLPVNHYVVCILFYSR